MEQYLRPFRLSRCYVYLLIMTTMAALQCNQAVHAQNQAANTSESSTKVLGLEKVIAFYGAYPKLESQTFARSSEGRCFNYL